MTDKPDPAEATKENAESTRRFGRGVRESAQQIWLAGLGALAKTQQEGSKFFETLVEEGGKVQAKTSAYTGEQYRQARKQAGPWIDQARKRTNDALGKLEQAFDERIARSLQRMRVPSRAEFDELSARVEEPARVKGASRTTARKTGTRKSADAKPDAKKP